MRHNGKLEDAGDFTGLFWGIVKFVIVLCILSIIAVPLNNLLRLIAEPIVNFFFY